MIYILKDYDDIEAVLEGPDGLDVRALMRAFFDRFGSAGMGPIPYPEYTGPVKPLPSAAWSGFGGGGYGLDSLTPDTSSPEYAAWLSARRVAEGEWFARRKAAVNAARLTYPGATEQEMCLSYLRIEHGLTDASDKVRVC